MFPSDALCTQLTPVSLCPSLHLTQTLSHHTFLILRLFSFPTYYFRCDARLAELAVAVSSGERRLIRLQREVAELRQTVERSGGEGVKWCIRPVEYKDRLICTVFVWLNVKDIKRQK